jgi:hypothetical protein
MSTSRSRRRERERLRQLLGSGGDCDSYHGFVVAASETDGHVVGSFQVAPANNGGAVWGTSGRSSRLRERARDDR